MDSSRSSCTCHWLSSCLSEPGNKRGQAGAQHVWDCGGRSVLARGYGRGALIGMSQLHAVCCVCEGERGWYGGGPIREQLSERAGVTVSLPGPWISNKTQYKFGLMSTACIHLFWFFFWGLRTESFSSRFKICFFFVPLSEAFCFLCYQFWLSSYFFISQVAECRRLEKCQIHLQMWKPSPGLPHPLCLLHPRL